MRIDICVWENRRVGLGGLREERRGEKGENRQEIEKE